MKATLTPSSASSSEEVTRQAVRKPDPGQILVVLASVAHRRGEVG